MLKLWLTLIADNKALARLYKIVHLLNGIGLEDDMEQNFNTRGTFAAPSDAQSEAAAMRVKLRIIEERKIDELPDALCMVFVLRVLEEMLVEELGNVLGILQATVRPHHFRRRSMLRESFASELDTETDKAFNFDRMRCDRLLRMQ